MAKSSRYFHLHCTFLRIMGMGMFHDPESGNLDNFSNPFYILYTFLGMVYLSSLTVLEVINIRTMLKGNMNIDALFYTLVIIGIHIMSLMKFVVFIKNNEGIQRVVKMLQIDTNRLRTDPDIEKESIYRTNFLTYIFVGIAGTTMILTGLFGFVKDAERSRLLKESNYTIDIPRDLHTSLYIPWNINDDVAFTSSMIGVWFGLSWIGIIIVVMDTLMSCILIHISGQFKMIKKLIENFGNNTIDFLMNSLDENSKRRCERLKDEYMILYDHNEDLFRNNYFLAKKRSVLKFFNEDQFDNAMNHCLIEIIEYHQLIIE
jgi:hypothetical protein